MAKWVRWLHSHTVRVALDSALFTVQPSIDHSPVRVSPSLQETTYLMTGQVDMLSPPKSLKTQVYAQQLSLLQVCIQYAMTLIKYQNPSTPKILSVITNTYSMNCQNTHSGFCESDWKEKRATSDYCCAMKGGKLHACIHIPVYDHIICGYNTCFSASKIHN